MLRACAGCRHGGPYYAANGHSAGREGAETPDPSLEDEIFQLRCRLEQLFMQEQSLTSDNVVRISGMLDLKINEYMKSRRR